MILYLLTSHSFGSTIFGGYNVSSMRITNNLLISFFFLFVKHASPKSLSYFCWKYQTQLGRSLCVLADLICNPNESPIHHFDHITSFHLQGQDLFWYARQGSIFSNHHSIWKKESLKSMNKNNFSSLSHKIFTSHYQILDLLLFSHIRTPF